MKILIVCSTSFYDKVEPIKLELERRGFLVELPNCYDNPVTNDDNKNMTEKEYFNFFKEMYYESRDKVKNIDAILVLNFDKKKDGVIHQNYIGTSTFLEMYEAFMQQKKIFIFNDYPNNMLFDEIKGFNPIILNGDLNQII